MSINFGSLGIAVVYHRIWWKEKGSNYEKTGCQHIRNPGWHNASSWRTGRGSHRQLYIWRVVVQLLGRHDGPELWVHGSSNLIQTLLKHHLIDELRVWIFPVVIGKGKRLFGEGTSPSSLKLINSKTSSTGVILATYEPSGELKTASFALDNPS